jgi:hypothetical protein
VRIPAILVFSCIAAATTASAQTTWKGLHFGESREDVRAQLTAQSFTVEATQDGSLQSTADYELAVPGLRHTFPMIASFQFDDNLALADITLSLDLAGMRRYWATVGPEDALMNFAAEKLTGALSGRYGAPIYRSTACDAELKQNPGFCIVSWRGSEQTVEMERAASAKGLRLLIRYQPLATDL